MEQSQVFTRKLSLADLVYAASGYRESDQNQLVSQMIVEGDGEIEEQALKDAVQKVAITIPASRSCLKGFWGIKYWSASGPLPTVRTLYQEWNGHYQSGLSFIDKPLDLIRGPVAEIIQIVGSKTYILFRVHHAVTDGVGLVDYIRSIFQALNQKQPPLFHSKVTVEKLPHGNLNAIPPRVSDASPPFPLDHENHLEFDRSRIWERVTVQGSDRKILLKSILAIAELARGESDNSIRIHVPASLRRHVPGENTSANLIGMVRLDVSKQDTCKTLVKKFNAELAVNQELPIAVNSLTSKLTFWIPLRLLKRMEKLVISKLLKQPRFRCSGTVSSVGKIDTSEYSTASFSANSCFGIPVSPLGSPVMVGLVANEHSTEIVLTVNRTLISDHGMKELTNKFYSMVTNLK